MSSRNHARARFALGLIALVVLATACPPAPGDPVPATSTTTTSTTTTTTPSDPDGFDITLRLAPSISPVAASVIQQAAVRWESVVTADQPDIAVSVPAGTFAASNPGLSAVVDDLFVDVVIEPTDGIGGQVAAAGPVSFHTDGTASYGVVIIDSDDIGPLSVDSPLVFLDTIVHEMGHILLGATTFQPLVITTPSGSRAFTGANAVAAYHALGGSGFVPMSGTGHWSEVVFGSELMTPISAAGRAPLSTVTIGALADVGYAVDLGAADPYVLPTP